MVFINLKRVNIIKCYWLNQKNKISTKRNKSLFKTIINNVFFIGHNNFKITNNALLWKTVSLRWEKHSVTKAKDDFML